MIENDVIRDSTENAFAGISDKNEWSFTSEDVAPPTISSLTPEDDEIDVDTSANLVITFNENIVKGSGNIIITNATTTNQHESINVTSGQVTISSNIVTINPSVNFDGESDYYVEFASGVFEDESANVFGGISGATTWNFTVEDVASPTVVVSTTESSPTSASPFSVTITFSEAVQDFIAGDISVTNGTASNLITSNDTIFTADITPDGELTVSIMIPTGVAQDLSGNGNVVSNEISVDYDSTSPSVVLSATESSPTNVSPFVLTIEFNEGVTDFEITDLTLANCTADNFIEVKTDTTFTVNITPSADGTVTVDLVSGKAHDYAGNGNTASNQFIIDYDGSAPLVDILYPANNADSIAVSDSLQITFDENVYLGSGNIQIYKVTGFEWVEDISVAALSGYGTKIITINPSDFESETEYYVLIDAGVFTDLVGNDFAGIISTTDWTFTAADISEPTVSLLNPTDGAIDVVINSDLVITFNENVTANVGNITIMNDDTNLEHEVIDVSSGQVTIVSDVVTINPSVDFDGQTNYYVLVDESSFQDGSGNNFGGITVTTDWNFFTEDKNAPVVITLSPDNVMGVTVTTDLVITFDENVFLNTGNITIYDSNTDSIYETIAIGSVNITSNVVTINPVTNLNGLTGYHVLIDSAALEDGLGNAYGGITDVNEWTFITADVSAPLVNSLTPEDDEFDVDTSANLVITFNENVVKGSGNIIITNATTSSQHESIDVTSGQVTISSNVVTINPSVNFDGETDYYVLVDNGAFQDTEANDFGGIIETTDWNFTTRDITAPLKTSLLPLDDATGVSVIADLEITFNENVLVNNGNITIMNATSGLTHEVINITSGEISISGNILTISPSTDFAGLTDYYVLIASTAIRDESGNDFAGISDTTIWNFTTGNTTAPGVINLSPLDNSIGIVVTSNLQITFNETVVANAGNITIMNSTTSTTHEIINVTSAQVSIASNVVTINPITDFDGLSDYYVLIDDGAFRDIDANNYIGISSSSDWNFTTAGASAPIYLSLTPADDSIGVSITSDLVITFNETVVANTGNITIYDSNTDSIYEQISVTSLQVSISTDIVTVNPSVDFAGETNYYVFVDYGAFRDTEANDFGGILDPVIWNFTTEDITAPEISSLTPADNATNVGINSNLEITFDEDIFANTGNITIYDSNTDTIYEQIAVSSALVTISINIVTINPSTNFVENTAYYVLIDNDVFRDDAGNGFTGITGITTWNFVSADITVPTIIALSPTDDAVDVTVNSDLQITFSENVVANTGLITIMDASSTHESIDVLSAQVSIVSNVVTINPGIDFDGDSSYYVLIAGNAFHDESGNSFAGISDQTTWNFTAGDITQPSVTITSSETGTVTGNFDVTITFSELVTGFTSDDITVTNATVGTFTESTADLIWTVTIEPIADGDVTVDINGGVAQDAAGNVNTAANQFSVVYDSGTGFEDIIPYEISIYSIENRVILEFTNEGNYQFNKGVIEIYNLLGQKIADTEINNFVKFETELDHVSQIYIVKVVIDGIPYTKRLYIE